MKKRTKIITIIVSIVSLIVIVLSSFAIYGAYYGRGIFKDVFVNREYYFTSNTLRSVDSLADSKDVSLATRISYGNDQQTVVIYNYNQNTGEYHNYDIKFKLYAWLEGDFTTDERNYTITISGSSDSITLNNSSAKYSSGVPDPIASNLELTGKQMSAVTITIDYNLAQSEDVTTLPKVVMAAQVETPKFMNNRMLGGKFVASRGTDFQLDSAVFTKNCSHADPTACTTKEYAGFTYQISCLGNPKANDKLIVKFDASVLSLDKYSDYYQEDLEVDEEDGLTIIEINPSDNFRGTLVFYRNITSDIWEEEKDDNTSWDELSAYITTTLEKEE